MTSEIPEKPEAILVDILLYVDIHGRIDHETFRGVFGHRINKYFEDKENASV